MKKLAGAGRIIFALSFFAEGIICIVSQNFVVGRPPGWATEVHPILADVGGVLLILSALAILVNKFADVAAAVIAAIIIVLTIPGHLMHFMDDWGNAYKSFALCGGATIVFLSVIANEKASFQVSASVQKALFIMGTVFISAFFLVSGYAHFKYAVFAEGLIPTFIPFRLFWTYFCGVCLFAGGIGILIPTTRGIAALLSGVMVMGWFLLLHIPRYVSNPSDPSDRLGVCESFAFAGVFFVLAGLSKFKVTSVNYSQLRFRSSK